MTEKKFEPYWTNTDEGCFEYLGRIGNKNLVCRICGKAFQKELDENNGIVLMDSTDLEEHYKECHSGFIDSENLEFYSGKTGDIPIHDDYPHIIIVHESTHKPKTTDQEPYFHVYLLRKKKGTQGQYTPTDTSQHSKSKWVTVYKNVGSAKLSECLIKQLEGLERNGFDLQTKVRFAIYKNKLGNWTISSKVLKDNTDEEGIFDAPTEE